MTTLEVLTHPRCACTPLLQQSLQRALHRLDGWWIYAAVDQQALTMSDVRRWYPAPTVLCGGRDLFGLAPAREHAGLT